MSFEGIYTAYLSGKSGQAMAMFVFKEGKVAGADMTGLLVSGTYESVGNRIDGNLTFRSDPSHPERTMPDMTSTPAASSFPFSLPECIDPKDTYRLQTPFGPVNAKLIKSIGL